MTGGARGRGGSVGCHDDTALEPDQAVAVAHDTGSKSVGVEGFVAGADGEGAAALRLTLEAEDNVVCNISVLVLRSGGGLM